MAVVGRVFFKKRRMCRVEEVRLGKGNLASIAVDGLIVFGSEEAKIKKEEKSVARCKLCARGKLGHISRNLR